MINPGADPGLLIGSILVVVAAIGHTLFGAVFVIATDVILSNPIVWSILSPILVSAGLDFFTPLLIGIAIGLFFGLFLIALLVQVIFSSKCLSCTNLLFLLINMIIFLAVAAVGVLAPSYTSLARSTVCGLAGSMD
jgi:hypothetical protein